MLEQGPLKILHILDHSLPFHSGYAFRAANIIKAQAGRGWDPVALTSPEHNKVTRTNEIHDEMIAGFRYYRTRTTGSGNRQISRIYRDAPALGRRIREVIALERPDILHVHSPVFLVFPAWWNALKRGIPLIYEVRAFWEDADVEHGAYEPWSWRYRLMAAMENWACRSATQVAVLCGGLKNDLAERGIPAAKLTAVFNGVNLKDFRAQPPDPEYRTLWNLEGKRVIGFVGSFFSYEGLDLLVQAMAEVARTRPDLALLLVGGGRTEGVLSNLIERLGMRDKVIMPGRISHDRIAGVYGLIDVLAYPRRSIRLTELVTPLKPLEAMAMGKPVIASDIGGHRELIDHGKTGLLFAAGSVPALSETLGMVLDDSRLRSNLAVQASAWIRKHSWDHTTAVYDDIYSRTLNRQSGRAARLNAITGLLRRSPLHASDARRGGRDPARR